MFQKGGGQLRSPLLPPRRADGVRNKNPARGPFAKGGKLGRGRNPSKNAKRRVPPGNTWARHRFLTKPPPRRRRLSSITRAPCRKVMGVPGQRSQAARKVASAT